MQLILAFSFFPPLKPFKRYFVLKRKNPSFYYNIFYPFSWWEIRVSRESLLNRMFIFNAFFCSLAFSFHLPLQSPPSSLNWKKKLRMVRLKPRTDHDEWTEIKMKRKPLNEDDRTGEIIFYFYTYKPKDWKIRA